MALASIALSGCGATHRLDRTQERRLLGDIASARRAAAAHDRPGARAALERFLAAVDQLRHRGTLTAAQASALIGQGDGALKVALAIPASGASPGAGEHSATFTGEDSAAAHTGTGASATGATAQTAAGGAAAPASPSAPAQTPPGAKPPKPSSPPSGAAQGPAQPNGPHGGPGQGHQPPGKARKQNDGGNDNQGGDG